MVKEETLSANSNGNKLRIIPLGGLGEIGMNMMAFEFGDDIIVVDCGVMFPGEDTPGVDLIIPDTTYLEDHKDKVRAFIITHCHEDHIGALPYILPLVNVPVYGTKLTLGLIQPKLKEHKILDSIDLRIVKPRDIVDIGCFRVEFIRVTHSTVDCVALGIHTPIGTVIHTGDFKIDPTPVDGEVMDFHTLARLAEEKVLLLLSDSTNVEREGYTLSERDVGDAFDRIFQNAPGRIIAATFSSNIHRVQQLIDVAEKYDRRFILTGRSMVNNMRIANELGYLHIPAKSQATFNDLKKMAPLETLIITTGSQGEPMSALSRMAHDEHKNMDIEQGDTVIISARIIPGNEKSIARTINNVYRRGAEVFYENVSEIHVSGHASQEEQKMMINLVKPEYFIPIHGEYRHLVHHAQLAQRCGIPEENTLIIENGDVVELSDDGMENVGREVSGRVFVDGKGVGDVGDTVLRDRRHLSTDGMCIVTVGIDRNTGAIIRDPDVITRGFVYEEEASDLISAAENKVKDALEAMSTQARMDTFEVQEEIIAALRKFLFKRTKRRPMILPIIIEL
jgi:ribonuclease J